ncbi:MAG: putative sulfate exporter family transporter [Halieaceae bacterium]|nr:putative sulfate exporter family transporter [Halieaceae bacterium]MBT6333826.1 putative sulfate exporter family transporter [Halieaceae bacterium]MDG1829124.1 putative sulfate exporter family transporter [Luminiphilus sp.]
MIDRLIAVWAQYFPGVAVATAVALAASFIAQRYGAPAMLMGLLLGMAFHFLNETPRVGPGLELVAVKALRLGVALLGLRLTVADVASLGWTPVLLVVCAVLATLLFGVVLGRLLGCERQLGVLTGGSVAICGASAAMAISSVLPKGPDTQRQTLFTIIGVTSLSTIAMVLYPIIGDVLQFNDQEMGIFIGATIHDVAQVVGAGYSVSPTTGDLGTFIKLLRVAMLVPVVLVIGIIFRNKVGAAADREKAPAFPLFLIGFIVLFAVNSTGLIPGDVIQPVANLAPALLLVAIAALGIRTSMQEVMTIGLKPVLLIVGETLFIAAIIVAYLLWIAT